MKKKLFFGVLLLALLGGLFAYKTYNKPHQNISKAKSVLAISAKDLFTGYQKSEDDANVKYLGKIITVEGVIEEINENGENKNQIILSTNDMMSRISCDLDYLSDHPKLSGFKVGDQIKLKGKCTGLLMDVVLDRCVIL